MSFSDFEFIDTSSTDVLESCHSSEYEYVVLKQPCLKRSESCPDLKLKQKNNPVRKIKSCKDEIIIEQEDVWGSKNGKNWSDNWDIDHWTTEFELKKKVYKPDDGKSDDKPNEESIFDVLKKNIKKGINVIINTFKNIISNIFDWF